MPRKRPALATDAAHPLEVAVIEVFRKRSPQDRVTLACGLASPNPWSAPSIKLGPNSPRLGISPNKAYLMIAEDVLGWMLSQGKLVRDANGWYRLAAAVDATDPKVTPQNESRRRTSASTMSGTSAG